MTYINIILVNNVQAYYDGATGMVACHGVWGGDGGIIWVDSVSIGFEYMIS